MWAIRNTDFNGNDNVINTIFSNKNDAIKYSKAYLEYDVDISCIEFINLEKDLIFNDISTGDVIYINNADKKKQYYGTISDISNYLVDLEDIGGNSVTFTKARINKEILRENFFIEQKNALSNKKAT